MRKKIVAILACCFCFMLILAGCGGIQLSGGPAANDPVYGNGGLAVRKGDYLYFVNAFKSQETVDVNENKFGTQKVAGIYRVKLNEYGVVNTDEDGMPVGAELLAAQIAGYESGALYIFGNYIYYTTPKTLKSRDGQSQRGLYSFERIRLDGTDHRTLYSTTELTSQFQFTYYQMGRYVYILFYNGSRINSIEVEMNGGGVYNQVLARSVTSVAFPIENSHTSNSTTFSTYVYYTKATTQKTDGFVGGTKVLRAKIDGSAKDKVVSIGNDGYKLNQVKNNRLYFELNSKIYSTDIASTNGLKSARLYANNTTEFVSEYHFLNDQNQSDLGMIAKFESKIVWFETKDTRHVLVNEDATIVAVVGNFVYYTLTESGKFYRQNIYQSFEDKELVAESINLTGLPGGTYVHICGTYVYYFNTVEESNQRNYYLHMIKIGAQNEEGDLYTQFIGKLSSGDVKK